MLFLQRCDSDIINFIFIYLLIIALIHISFSFDTDHPPHPPRGWRGWGRPIDITRVNKEESNRRLYIYISGSTIEMSVTQKRDL